MKRIDYHFKVTFSIKLKDTYVSQTWRVRLSVSACGHEKAVSSSVVLHGFDRNLVSCTTTVNTLCMLCHWIDDWGQCGGHASPQDVAIWQVKWQCVFVIIQIQLRCRDRWSIGFMCRIESWIESSQCSRRVYWSC